MAAPRPKRAWTKSIGCSSPRPRWRNSAKAIARVLLCTSTGRPVRDSSASASASWRQPICVERSSVRSRVSVRPGRAIDTARSGRRPAARSRRCASSTRPASWSTEAAGSWLAKAAAWLRMGPGEASSPATAACTASGSSSRPRTLQASGTRASAVRGRPGSAWCCGPVSCTQPISSRSPMTLLSVVDERCSRAPSSTRDCGPWSRSARTTSPRWRMRSCSTGVCLRSAPGAGRPPPRRRPGPAGGSAAAGTGRAVTGEDSEACTELFPGGD